jgi:dihydroorotase
MLGLQTALSVVVASMVRTGLLDWRGVADRMSVRPARIGRVTDQGRPLAIGEPAHLTLVDPEVDRRIDRFALAGPSTNSPYDGMVLPASVDATFFHGRPTVLDRKVMPT